MKVKDLQAQIDRAIAADPSVAEANIVFGPEEGDHIPLKGGIVGRGGNGYLLILAPLPLDKVGGF
jgi:hypothetical protein